MSGSAIRLVIADVDGTLLTSHKVLTARTLQAVRSLDRAGILFAITSGRPPRGMSMLLEALDLTTPVAAFNGGIVINRDMSVLEKKIVPRDVVAPVIHLLESCSLRVWIYRGTDWYIREPDGPHVAHEGATVQFAPTVVDSFDDLTDDVCKLVGVSDDFAAVTRASVAVCDRMGDHVSAAPSQPYYLDVTHPDANKGAVAKYLAAHYRIPSERIATIGDMPTDVLMFAHSGLSIAMGNASPAVQRTARRVTSSNDDEGFANAVEQLILKRGDD